MQIKSFKKQLTSKDTRIKKWK